MSYFETNMIMLSERFPELAETAYNCSIDKKYEVLSAKNGQVSLKANINGKSIFMHSSYDPGKEAKKIVGDHSLNDSDIVFVFGLGLGYQLQEIIQKAANKKAHVVVIEKDPRIFRLALENTDMSEILNYPHIYLYVDLPVMSVIFEVHSNLKPTIAKQIVFLDHPSSIQLYEEYYTEILRLIRDSVSLKLNTVATVFEFKGDWLKNTLKNLPTVLNSPGIISLQDKFQDIPAIIVSAGPSLDKNVKYLKEAKGKAIIIAVGTTLRTLFKENIMPDMVITYDASDLNYEHFRGIDYNSIPLFYEPMVYPRIVEEHHGIKFVYNSKPTEFNNEVEEISCKGLLSSGGSIATSAFSLACLAGSNPIIFIGQDLSIKDGKTHANNTIFGENRVDIKNSLHYFETPGYYGEPVMISRGFYAFLRWFETHIERIPDKLVINATEGGAMIKGTKQLPFIEAIKRYCLKDVNVGKVLLEIANRYHPQNFNKLKEKLSSIIDDLDQLAKDAKKAGDLCGELERVYRQKNNIHNKFKKIMRQLDTLDEKIKTNKSAKLLTEMIQDILLRSERGELVQENEKDDDFVRAEKHAASLRLFYVRVYEASKEIASWFRETIDKGDLTHKGEGQYASLR